MLLYDKTIDLGGRLAKLVSISDFSKGKTSNIFEDVKANNAEYVVLKNNQPTGVIISYEWYDKMKSVLIDYKEMLEKKSKTPVLIGCGKGEFQFPKNFDKWDNEITKLFEGV